MHRSPRLISTMSPKIPIIFSLILAVGAVPLHQQWNQFKSVHKKHYSSPSEEARRLTIFVENLAQIRDHNAKYARGEVSYAKSMNHFGDLTPEEFLEFVNRGKGGQLKRNETFRLEWTKADKPAASAVDWRSQAVSEVKNQGQCGSCWSFSTTGAVEGQLALQTGRLVSLSEQNLIDCSTAYGNAGCDGGWMDSAFDYIRDYGIMSERSYPYEAQMDYCRFDPSQSVTRVSGYYDLPPGDESSLLNAVANNGPVAVAIDATEELQFYSRGVFYDMSCNTENLNHGVLVVGYGADSSYDYWLVKNSWGAEWGEAGYYRAVRNYGNNCGIATAASYPVL